MQSANKNISSLRNFVEKCQSPDHEANDRAAAAAGGTCSLQFDEILPHRERHLANANF